jgi:glucose/arabinose dehydrogenase
MAARSPIREFGKARSCSEFTPPAQPLGPHVASLGMKFYTGTQFPAKYRNQIIIAEQGSWNRTAKIGYRLTLVTLDGNNARSYEPFVDGCCRDRARGGVPVDVLVAPDGSLLVSDDHAGAIYRIRYESR